MTERNARRILNNLMKVGLAEIIGEEAPGARGRQCHHPFYNVVKPFIKSGLYHRKPVHIVNYDLLFLIIPENYTHLQKNSY